VFLQSKKEARKQASLPSRTLFVNCFFSFEVKTKKEKKNKEHPENLVRNILCCCLGVTQIPRNSCGATIGEQ
jgi:hypothetical protein